MNRIERFIGWRYLVSKRSVKFINVIGIVSVVGIAAGVAALLVALSVFNGFNSVVTSVLVSFDPHIRIEKKGAMDVEEYSAVSRVAAADPRVVAISPFISGKVLITAGYHQRVVSVRGIGEKEMNAVTGIGSKLVLGDASLGTGADTTGIIIGITLADRLSSVVGSAVTVVSPAGLQPALTGAGAPRQFRFTITGIFESQNKEYDANVAFVSLGAAQALFEKPGMANGMDVRVSDISGAEGVKKAVAGRLGPQYTVSTWYDLHRSLYSVMQIERWSAYVLLSLIIAVASFNVLGSLTMSVLEKKRDIAVLRSCGLPRRSVVKIFLFEGLLTGVAGTAAGMLMGLAVVLLQQEFRLFPLDPTVYIIPAIPVEIRLWDLFSVAAAS
ncbi:MAG TPA: ABC transporter permease, partial [Bacteroidota bacterium]|nr:ABC transporter permease [Bacteroidota bacterium]